jgi:type IV fimbrial biogenesis protein FimT
MPARGFTLLEGLIVVAIVGLLLLAGMPMVADVVTNNRVRAIAETMRDGLSLARTEAIRRNATISFVPNGAGWSIVKPAVGLVPATTLVTRAPLADVGAINAQPSDAEISYNGSGRLTTAGPFTVQVTRAGSACIGTDGGTVRCLNVEAVRGGQIRMCDPAQSASAPEGC